MSTPRGVEALERLLEGNRRFALGAGEVVRAGREQLKRDCATPR